MATTDLGKWMITNGGNYDPEATYEQLTMVMYDNSTYITLKTVTGVTPSNDGVNYILMAQGFNATALSAVTATDTSGLLGDSGKTVSAQSLVDYLADAVATKLLKKTDIATVQSGSTTTVPASALLKTTDDKIGDTSDLPGDAGNVVSALVSLNSELENKMPATAKYFGRSVSFNGYSSLLAWVKDNQFAFNVFVSKQFDDLPISYGFVWAVGTGTYNTGIKVYCSPNNSNTLYVRTTESGDSWATEWETITPSKNIVYNKGKKFPPPACGPGGTGKAEESRNNHYLVD